jgi:hypothetical protein
VIVLQEIAIIQTQPPKNLLGSCQRKESSERDSRFGPDQQTPAPPLRTQKETCDGKAHIRSHRS